MGYIYIIRNSVNGKFYLGSTKSFHKRRLRHFNELRKNKHHSIHLQRAWNKYGGQSFEFIIIETCYNHLKREQELLDKVDLQKDTYNVSSMATGGYMLENHPNKEAIIKKNTEVLLNAPKPKPRYKDKNPNWRGGKTFCKCGARINNTAESCIKCQDRTGKNNHFYGKKHNDSAKERIRQSRLGKYNGNQEKIVIIGDIEYKSVSEASRELGVSPATIVYRIKSISKKFKDYKYK